jgi:hypothetical protein
MGPAISNIVRSNKPNPSKHTNSYEIRLLLMLEGLVGMSLDFKVYISVQFICN